jgi:hypothetical protein
MSETNEELTEPTEQPTEEIIEPPPIKSRKNRSELQLKALENARVNASKKRTQKAIEKAEIKKKLIDSQNAEKLHIESEEKRDELIEDIPENISELSAENGSVEEETDTERIERHSQREEFNNHINNLIDERVKHNKPAPIVIPKSKFKFIDGVYVLREK